MARIEDVDRRLCNWARWSLGAGSGGLGFASSGLVSGGGGGGYGYRDAVIPTVDCEAEETNRAVQSLDERLRLTLTEVYIGAGSMKRKAAGMGVSEAAVNLRVWDAHRRLAAWFSERQREIRSERQRVEMLGLSGRR